MVTRNYYGGGDTFQHYNLAHWGWKYPRLLFSHWGKPVFTILISPLAQLGFKGAQIMNLLFGFLTAIVIWKISSTIKLKYANLSPFMVLAIPIYVPLMFSSLTEVSFSFFLSLSILLFLRKQYIGSALFISLLPLIRTESIVLIPLFLIAFLLKRKILHIALFSTGFWIISYFGKPYYDGDLFWLINAMPYKGDAVSIYGSGTWYHFIWNGRERAPIITEIVGILFFIGIYVKFLNWFKTDRFRLTENFYVLWLVAGSYVVFFAAHSYVWWKGMGNSLGLQRVIGSVTPLAALMAVIGIEFVLERIKKLNARNKLIAGYALVGLIFIIGIVDYRRSFSPSGTQKVQIKASDYIIENNLDQHKIYYFSPFLIFKTGIDPYNYEQSSILFQNYDYPSRGIPDSSIIIWDAHFGPNEGRIPFQNLERDKSLVKLNTFRPEKPFTVLGGYDYRVVVYQKILAQNDTLYNNVFLDFEDERKFTTDKYKHNGRYSRHVKQNHLYINGNVAYLDEVVRRPGKLEIGFEGYLFVKDTSDLKLNLVVSIHDNQETDFFRSVDISTSNIIPGEWNMISGSMIVTETPDLDKLIKVFLLNKNKREFYLDDLSFTIKYLIFDNTYYSTLSKRISESSTVGEFSDGLKIETRDIFTDTGRIKVEVTGYILPKNKNVEDVSLVCSVSNEDEVAYYDFINIVPKGLKEKEWHFFNHVFYIDTFAHSNELLKVYVWNKYLHNIDLKDFNVRIFPAVEVK